MLRISKLLMIVFFCSFLFAPISNTVVAGLPVESDSLCRGGGDHDVPTPFDAADIRFELADGEIYLLTGRVVFLPLWVDQGSNKLIPHLAIDLSQYPWLANSKRQQTPFYPLEGDPLEWREWINFPIKMMCRAHGSISSHHGKLEYVISLEPIERP